MIPSRTTGVVAMTTVALLAVSSASPAGHPEEVTFPERSVHPPRSTIAGASAVPAGGPSWLGSSRVAATSSSSSSRTAGVTARSPGEYIMDVVGREPGATRNGQALQLLDKQSADVFAARAHLTTRASVDAGRIAVAGGSFGGIQTRLAAVRWAVVASSFWAWTRRNGMVAWRAAARRRDRSPGEPGSLMAPPAKSTAAQSGPRRRAHESQKAAQAPDLPAVRVDSR